MFRKILIVAMCATAAGYCFAEEVVPQVVTSEVFYTQETQGSEVSQYQNSVSDAAYGVTTVQVPAWPLAGSDADVAITCDGPACLNATPNDDNIRIVSKIGEDLVVENNINLGTSGDAGYKGWSGGANLLHGTRIPVGFDNECTSGAEMPLLHREVLEDDGGNVLAVSRSGRGTCGGYADGYLNFATKNGMRINAAGQLVNADGVVVDENGEVMDAFGNIGVMSDVIGSDDESRQVTDTVRSWIVASGETLRSVLQSWCDKEGWDLVWTTSREYPIEASAVFKGRFVDVASALVRNFARANPIPYAKFYKGNRVLVISTGED